MEYTYTARLYLGEKIIMQTAGNDVAQLYVWMLSNANEKLCHAHGEIIDNQTKKVVQQFRKDEGE